MLQQIEEIQGLATKYSKAELGRMVQMGILDPQKAMMAGMMIQRISQQNAQPPQTTVAQDVLGLPAVSSPEQAQAQPPAQAQPQMPPQAQGTGIEALPAGEVGSYAGGGIVSFDDGGEVEGYADGGVPKKSKYDDLIYSAAEKANVDPGVFRRLIFTESSFNPNAVSYSGRDAGLGIAQISKHHKLTEAQRLDPKFSLGYAAKYLKGLVDKSGGDYRKALEKYKGVASEKGRQRMGKAIATVLGEPYEASPTRLAAVTPKRPSPKIDTIDNPFAMREEVAPEYAPTETNGLAGLGDVNHLAMLSTPQYEMPEDAVGGFAGGGLAAFAGGGVPGYAGGVPPNDPSWQVSSDKQKLSDAQRLQILMFELHNEELKEAQGDQRAGQNALMLRREIESTRRKMGQAPAVTGVQQLPPIAEAKNKPAPVAKVQSTEEAVYDPMTGVQISGPAPTPAQRLVKPGAKYTPSLLGDFFSGPVTVAAPPPTAPTVAGATTPAANAPATVPTFVPPVDNSAASQAAPTGVAQLPPIQRPSVGEKSYADYVKETTPSVEEMKKPEVEELSALAAKRKEAYAAEGYDPEMYNQRVTALEKKREAVGGDRERAIGEAIMTAGLKLMGARRGQEFQALSEGAQEGLKGYQAAVKDIKSMQEKYDERMDAYRLADMQARKTGVDTDMARREKQLEAARAVETELFRAKNDAAKIGAQAAAQLTSSDRQLLGSMYGQELTAQTTREYTGALKEQQVEASKAKILVDAAGDFMTKNAANPKYMQNPGQLQTDAIAYANSIGVQLGIIPKGANIAAPPKPDASFYQKNFGITPTR